MFENLLSLDLHIKKSHLHNKIRGYTLFDNLLLNIFFVV